MSTYRLLNSKMFKVAILSLAFFSSVLAQTSFIQLSLQEYQSINILEGANWVLSRPICYSDGLIPLIIPLECGGNWGDNIFKARVSDDQFQLSEVLINPVKSSSETIFKWSCTCPGKSITHIQMLNIGEHRGFVESIASDGGARASAVVRVRSNLQVRILTMVYTT